MADQSGYPAGLDGAPADKAAGDQVPSADWNKYFDGVNNLQVKVGVDNSAVTTTVDYKLTQIYSGELSAATFYLNHTGAAQLDADSNVYFAQDAYLMWDEAPGDFKLVAPGTGSLNINDWRLPQASGNQNEILVLSADGATYWAAQGGGAELKVRADVALVSGDLVYITGWNAASTAVTVNKAKADAASTMPAVGMMDANCAQNATGNAKKVGTIRTLRTGAFSVGDTIYVSDSVAGSFMGDPPSYGYVQPIGVVADAHAGTGTIGLLTWGQSDFPSTSIVNQETPGGASNSVNKSYTIANPYVAGSLNFYHNGILLDSGVDFVEVAGGLSAAQAPDAGDVLLADYVMSRGALDAYLHEEFTPNATGQAIFDMAGTYTVGSNSLMVFYNGLYQKVGAANDYVETDNNTITFNAAITGGNLTLHVPRDLRIADYAKMRDQDDDTLIQVEESADEDIIRFDTGGTERLRIESDGTVTKGTGSDACLIKTGGYTGDGAVDQDIAGVGFAPKYVRITLDLVASGADNVHECSDQDAAGLSMRHSAVAGVEHFTYSDMIITLDADGFSVDDGGVDDHPNKNLVAYNYLALG